ncbi:hypothetical protein [Paraliomyxa miuraensis]|uniref:hypothetical protein n=1 Tax=Paraliomyxa miuraensis TaxID=376150 RepID=UPI00224D5112|nr:hypothetical protein [Paraliomyxa miuraensis]MCX4242424.1 hypothetical protein [Paraliomyxa miuraensis]
MTDDSPSDSSDQPSAATFTREQDARILRGLVEDEAALLKWMREHGHSARSVRARAALLGLTNQIVQQCRINGTWPSMRECLACEQRFLSTGSQHRLCRRCRQLS